MQQRSTTRPPATTGPKPSPPASDLPSLARVLRQLRDRQRERRGEAVQGPVERDERRQTGGGGKVRR